MLVLVLVLVLVMFVGAGVGGDSGGGGYGDDGGGGDGGGGCDGVCSPNRLLSCHCEKGSRADETTFASPAANPASSRRQYVALSGVHRRCRDKLLILGIIVEKISQSERGSQIIGQIICMTYSHFMI